ncbi:unnamed protein product, partial [Musa banksii]
MVDGGPCGGCWETAANAVAVATALLMIAVALDCFVTRLCLGVGGSLHVIPLTHDAATKKPVVVLAFPCVVLAVACFVKAQGFTPRARDTSNGGHGNGKWLAGHRELSTGLLVGFITALVLRLLLFSLLTATSVANDSQWLPALGLAFLTYNSAAAVYRSVDDPWAVGFVVVAYVDLLLLFWCLRKFERSTESNRGGLKAAVWFLATLLTGMFAHKVAAIMPWPVAAIVYCMAAATAGGGFWAFFIYREP